MKFLGLSIKSVFLDTVYDMFCKIEKVLQLVIVRNSDVLTICKKMLPVTQAVKISSSHDKVY